ncbi:MAG: hypothetical protein IPP44_29930 [Ideonella sp.]|nr:hypothetical protein [Ideonella sp.]
MSQRAAMERQGIRWHNGAYLLGKTRYTLWADAIHAAHPAWAPSAELPGAVAGAAFMASPLLLPAQFDEWVQPERKV